MIAAWWALSAQTLKAPNSKQDKWKPELNSIRVKNALRERRRQRGKWLRRLHDPQQPWCGLSDGRAFKQSNVIWQKPLPTLPPFLNPVHSVCFWGERWWGRTLGCTSAFYAGMKMKCPLWVLHRCQGYIKARMKSEEKRRTRFHSGHGTSRPISVWYCANDEFDE